MPKPLIQTTGRRKEAVARVRLRPGSGKVTINGREIEGYFRIATHRMAAVEALRLTQTADVYDVDATIDGGGISGQAVSTVTGSGTTYTVETPSTGTVIRTFTLDSSSAPTSRT